MSSPTVCLFVILTENFTFTFTLVFFGLPVHLVHG